MNVLRRRCRLLVAAVLLFLVVPALVGWAARGAGAQVEPPPDSNGGGPPITTTTVAGRGGAAPTPAVEDKSTPQKTSEQLGDLFAGPRIGDYPDSRYLLYYGNQDLKIDLPNTPGPFDDIGRAVKDAIANKVGVPSQLQTPVPTERSATGTIMGWWWAGFQTIARMTRTIIVLMFGFGLVRVVRPIVETFSGLLDGGVVGPFRLRDVVGVAAGLMLAARLLHHRRLASTLGDVAISLVFVIGSWLLFAHPGAYFDTAATLGSEFAQLPFRAVDPANPNAARDQAVTALKTIETEIPWEWVNYGGELTGNCRTAANEVLAEGPYSTTADAPRTAMLAAGCKEEAQYNNDPSGWRLALLVALSFAVGLVGLFVVAAAFGFLRAQLGLCWHFAYGAVVLLFGSMPFARGPALAWFRSVVDDLLAMIVPAWTLAFMLQADRMILLIPPGEATAIQIGSLFLRTILLVGVNSLIFFKRKKIVNGAATFLSGNINRATARLVRADEANVDNARRTEQVSARDFMPGHRWATAGVIAGGVAVGERFKSGSNVVKKARSVASTVADPISTAASKTAAAGRTAAGRTVTAAGDAKAAASSAASSVSDAGRRAGAWAASRSATTDGRVSKDRFDAMSGEERDAIGPEHGPGRPDHLVAVRAQRRRAAEVRGAQRLIEEAAARRAAEDDARSRRVERAAKIDSGDIDVLDIGEADVA